MGRGRNFFPKYELGAKLLTTKMVRFDYGAKSLCTKTSMVRNVLLTVAAIHFFSVTNWLYTTRQSDEGVQTSHWCLACFFNKQLVRLTMLTTVTPSPLFEPQFESTDDSLQY